MPYPLPFLDYTVLYHVKTPNFDTFFVPKHVWYNSVLSKKLRISLSYILSSKQYSI